MDSKNYENVDQILIKRKWSLAFNLLLKESTNQKLFEYLSSDANYIVAYFIENLKDYDDLYLIENVDEKKANKVWNEAINLLTERPFSTTMQDAEDKLLAEMRHIYKSDSAWNWIAEEFSKETFSNDQEILNFFNQFTFRIIDFEFLNKFANGIVNLNEAENFFFRARLKIAIILSTNNQLISPQQAKLFLSLHIYNDKLLKEEKICIHNYIQYDYINDLKRSIFDDIIKAKKVLEMTLPNSWDEIMNANKLFEKGTFDVSEDDMNEIKKQFLVSDKASQIISPKLPDNNKSNEISLD
ncbi:8533_t:CDS:2, partial [Racocetra fulgida]